MIIIFSVICVENLREIDWKNGCNWSIIVAFSPGQIFFGAKISVVKFETAFDRVVNEVII